MPIIFKRFFFLCVLAAMLAANGVANANQWLSLDEATGHGVYVWDNGDRYEGKVYNGKFQGQGVFTWPSGERYEGEFQNDMRHGHGVFTFLDGQRYEGKFENGSMRQGSTTWKSGDRYTGEFKDYKPHGHGVLVWVDGDRYEGEFQNGTPHGHGMYTDSDGQRFEGEFQNGLLRQGSTTWKSGDRYTGELKDYKPHGHGVLIWVDGDRYEGKFQEGKIVQKRNQLPAAKVKPSPAFKDCPSCPEMVVIPAGSFKMGTHVQDEENPEYDSEERPVHRVTFAQSFAMGKTEVTQAQWRAVMGSNPSYIDEDEPCGDNCPVNMVSWHDAHEFIQKLYAKTGKIYRLPSEAEWEYSARAGTTTAYYWGENASHQYANYGSADCCGLLAQGRDKWEYSSPVGSFPPNAFGLYDMSGNVYEWVEDKFHSDYEGAPDDGSAWTEEESDYTPDGKCRYTYLGGECALGGHNLVIIRGGSLSSYDDLIRSGKRVSQNPEQRYLFLGFRIARSLP